MKPEDAASKNLDLSLIAGDAIREEEAKRVVNELDNLFAPELSSPAILGNGLKSINHDVSKFVKGSLFNITSTDMSQPYEQFEHEGVDLVSRIVRVEANAKSDFFMDSSTYLIALMGSNQSTVTTNNCQYGAIKTREGQIEFFKIEKNQNLGKMVVQRAMQDTESERMLAQEGYIDQKEYKFTALSPEERYMAVSEFEKAVAAKK